jgi:hypothetical protein
MKRKLSSSYAEGKRHLLALQEEERSRPMIVRAEFKIAVLLEAESLEKAAATMAATSLSYIIAEMEDGEWLGTHEFTGVSRIHRWELDEACMAVGGDSSFFDNADKD